MFDNEVAQLCFLACFSRSCKYKKEGFLQRVTVGILLFEWRVEGGEWRERYFPFWVERLHAVGERGDEAAVGVAEVERHVVASAAKPGC